MNCKHAKVVGNTTKYYVCQIKNKAVNDYSCRDCVLRLKDKDKPDLPEGFEELFKGFRK